MQVFGIELAATFLHGLLLFGIAIGIENDFNTVREVGDPSRLAIDQLCGTLQGKLSPSRWEEVLTSPIVTVGQEYLPVQHNLVFFEMAFSTKRLRVNRIPAGNAQTQFQLQMVKLSSTLNHLLADSMCSTPDRATLPDS